jgi:hypothetical protein
MMGGGSSPTAAAVRAAPSMMGGGSSPTAAAVRAAPSMMGGGSSLTAAAVRAAPAARAPPLTGSRPWLSTHASALPTGETRGSGSLDSRQAVAAAVPAAPSAGAARPWLRPGAAAPATASAPLGANAPPAAAHVDLINLMDIPLEPPPASARSAARSLFDAIEKDDMDPFAMLLRD